MLPVTISLQQVRQGMITADDVLSPSGQLIIPKNTTLNPRLISRLKLYNVKRVCVIITEDVAQELNAKAEKNKPLNPEKTTQEFRNFNRTYQDMANDLEEAFKTVIERPYDSYDASPIINQILDLAKTVKNTMHLMNTLQLLREYDDTMYIHSISVALIAHTISLQMDMSEEDRRNLIFACAFHDIGKVKIPPEILYKPGRLTEDEFYAVKQHAQLGYEILNKAHFPLEIQLAALSHHERCDGSGYPTSLTMDGIPLFAKIIAVADVYDAMTARRSYRKEICSFDVIAEFENTGYQKFDVTVLLPFLTSIAQSHLNNKVRLSNSLIGTIVMINQHKLSKPVVNIDGTFIDLAKEKDLTIIDIL